MIIKYIPFLIMVSTVSISEATNINVVATTTEYSQKSNLTESPGSYLTEATVLVYDDILRFQKGPNGYMSDSDINAFVYNQFAGNVLWFMDELVGIESDWIKTAAADSTTAYGYVQFTEDSVNTAVTRYIEHLKTFNARKDTRDWHPYGIPLGTEISIPEWLTTLKNSTKTHEEKLDALTYDQTIALAFVHLHSKKSKDSNFVLMARGEVEASKDLYKNNHHTNPDAATLSRLNDFFKIHYIKAPVLTNKSKELIPVTELAANDLFKIESSLYTTAVNTIKSWFGW